MCSRRVLRLRLRVRVLALRWRRYHDVIYLHGGVVACQQAMFIGAPAGALMDATRLYMRASMRRLKTELQLSRARRVLAYLEVKK